MEISCENSSPRLVEVPAGQSENGFLVYKYSNFYSKIQKLILFFSPHAVVVLFYLKVRMEQRSRVSCWAACWSWAGVTLRMQSMFCCSVLTVL